MPEIHGNAPIARITRVSTAINPPTLQFFGPSHGRVSAGRMGRQRVDYYPSEQAVAVIDSLLTPFTPTRGPIIDRIIREWAANRGCRTK
jgi:hypothetical protein